MRDVKTVFTYMCDRCGRKSDKSLTEDETGVFKSFEVKVDWGDKAANMSPAHRTSDHFERVRWTNYDLCTECAQDLVKFINDGRKIL